MLLFFTEIIFLENESTNLCIKIFFPYIKKLSTAQNVEYFSTKDATNFIIIQILNVWSNVSKIQKKYYLFLLAICFCFGYNLYNSNNTFS